MPTAAQVAKIKAVADDARGHPAVRKIAIDKLEALRRSHPHLFHRPASAASASQGATRGRAPAPVKGKARFLDLANWRETANGNVSIVITVRGVEYRVVLFQHKQTPTWGWLIIDTDDGEETFSGRYPTRDEAHMDAWEALCAL